MIRQQVANQEKRKEELFFAILLSYFPDYFSPGEDHFSTVTVVLTELAMKQLSCAA